MKKILDMFIKLLKKVLMAGKYLFIGLGLIIWIWLAYIVGSGGISLLKNILPKPVFIIVMLGLGLWVCCLFLKGAVQDAVEKVIGKKLSNTHQENDRINDIENGIRDIKETLLWMAEYTTDPVYRNMYKIERKQYIFLLNATMDGRIKIGMSIEEFMDVVNKDRPKENDYDDEVELTNKYQFLLEKKHDFGIGFQGYGSGIPTPHIWVSVKDGEISSIRNDVVYPYNSTNSARQAEVTLNSQMRDNREKFDAIMQKTNSYKEKQV